MSLEIVLNPKISSRDQLKGMLVELGFTPTSHLWEWPEGSLHFSWFNEVDYQSYDGVEATIFPPSREECADLGDCAWALHTRTRVWASPADRQQQNELVRLAQSKFGGNFYNDAYGRNQFTEVEPDFRDAPARGIYLAYEAVTASIRGIQFVLPEPHESFDKLVGTKLEALASVDPTRLMYNALVPFAVAAFEHFFSCCFKILLHYEPRAQKLMKDQTKKVEIQDVLAIQSRIKTIEDVIANWYSFQNIDSVHTAFKKWLGIDIWNIFRQRKKIGDKLDILEIRLKELIDFRHGVIHRFSLDRGLRKEGVQEMLDLVLVVIETFVEYLENSEGKRIRN